MNAADKVKQDVRNQGITGQAAAKEAAKQLNEQTTRRENER